MAFLVATDLDGTLLRPDWTVSQRTRDALQSAQEAGVEVVYATGRPPRWLDDVYATTEHRPLTICANGALTLLDDEPLHIDAIPDEVVEEVWDLLLATRSDFVLRTERWRGHTLKLLAGLPGMDSEHADAVLHEVLSVAGHLVEPTHSAFNQLLIEMGPTGVTKAAALRRILAERWPDHTVIGIGDMPNDKALLESVDIPLTVASGHPWLREIAVAVLPGPADDGVAQLLEMLPEAHAESDVVSRFTAP